MLERFICVFGINPDMQVIDKLLDVYKRQGADGSTLDLYATEKEKLEIARLQSEYDKAMDLYGGRSD